MDFLELAKERYSVRKLCEKQVEQEKIDKILEAARFCPTAVNYQPQRIVILQDSLKLEQLKECTKYHFNAPLAMVVCYDEKVSWKHPDKIHDSGEVDASIAATQMMLEIHNIGLGTTWVGYFDHKKLSQMLELPEHIKPVVVFPIGYPSEQSKPIHLHYEKQNIDQMISYNTYKENK